MGEFVFLVLINPQAKLNGAGAEPAIAISWTNLPGRYEAAKDPSCTKAVARGWSLTFLIAF
jgi:hypothetical protein